MLWLKNEKKKKKKKISTKNEKSKKSKKCHKKESGQPVLASFLYVKRNYETISEKVPIRVKSWPNDKLAAGSNSNGTKWSVKFTKKSSWQTLCEKIEAIN